MSGITTALTDPRADVHSSPTILEPDKRIIYITVEDKTVEDKHGIIIFVVWLSVSVPHFILSMHAGFINHYFV